jgi:hypothetical protein
MREWACGACGVVHDRDTNAALNLLLGLERQPLAAEIPARSGVEDVKRLTNVAKKTGTDTNGNANADLGSAVGAAEAYWQAQGHQRRSGSLIWKTPFRKST